MKFAKQLNSLCQLGLDLPQLEYGHFKHTLKLAAVNPSNETQIKKLLELSSALTRNVSEINRSIKEQITFIENKAASTLKLIGPDRLSALSKVNKRELEDLLSLFLELRADFDRFVLYERTHSEGLSRLQRRASRFRGLADSRVSKAQELTITPASITNLLHLDAIFKAIQEALHHQDKRKIEAKSSIIVDSKVPSVHDNVSKVVACAIEDNHGGLSHEMAKGGFPQNLSLLELTYICGSTSCMRMLLQRPEVMQELTGTPCFLHSILRHHCRKAFLVRTSLEDPQDGNIGQSLSNEKDLTLLLEILARKILKLRPLVLFEKDESGRTPLHYVAEIGNTELVLAMLNASAMPDETNTTELILIPDLLQQTPLRIAMVKSRTEVFKLMLSQLHALDRSHEVEKKLYKKMVRGLLELAVTMDKPDCFHVLCTQHLNKEYWNEGEENLIYTAVRFGRTHFLQPLLEMVPDHKSLLDARETTYGWSPLFFACAEGNLEVVKHLVEAGASSDIIDDLGWTALEYAAYKGHLRVVEYLESERASNRNVVLSLGPLRKPLELSARLPSTFRERCTILMRLGSSNLRRPRDALCLNPEGFDHGENFLVNTTGLKLHLHLIGGKADRTCSIDIPVLSNETNHPFIFDAEDPQNAKLIVKICQTSNASTGASPITIGTGIAVVSDLRGGAVYRYESLVRDHTIPIISTDTPSFMGTVTFNLLIVKPFIREKQRPEMTQGFWNGPSNIEVVGHRGSGANKAKQKYLQIGENTMQGFLSAASMGASCVEFDVQLTKDFVPVIYHDFLIKDTGTETLIHTLTKDQFLHIGKAQDSRGDIPSSAERRSNARNEKQQSMRAKPRSRSVDEYDDSRMEDLIERLRLTSYGPTKAVKGNRRGFSIHEPLATLESLLRKLTEDIAFDLEIKYPMLWEAENQQFEPWGIEINFFVDTILSMIYKLAGNRNITFSSFNPEICILLSMKQQDYPVLFITKAGNVPTGDVRSSSLQEAIHFASVWGLAGIVSIIKPFQYCPRLIGYAKQHGLIVGAYGTTADDPDTVKTLAKAGLDAIITNRVRLISEALQVNAS